MKVLNLYAGIGGNRKLWTDVEVTAVEINPKIAEVYQDLYPNDTVIVGDASHIRKELSMKRKQGEWFVQNKPLYPDMKLYEEVLFLQGYYNGNYVVENVRSWYEPLIRPQEINKHYFWANFHISSFVKTDLRKHMGTRKSLEERKGVDLSKYINIGRKDVVLRNCTEPELGLHVFNAAGHRKSERVTGENLSLALASPVYPELGEDR